LQFDVLELLVERTDAQRTPSLTAFESVVNDQSIRPASKMAKVRAKNNVKTMAVSVRNDPEVA